MKKNLKTPDLLIIGAGPVGCVIAERAANIKNWTSLILIKEIILAGNCYDKLNSKGYLFIYMDLIICVLKKKF